MEKVKRSFKSMVLIMVILIAVLLIIMDVFQNIKRERNSDYLKEQLKASDLKLKADSTTNYWKESEFIED